MGLRIHLIPQKPGRSAVIRLEGSAFTKLQCVRSRVDEFEGVYLP